MPWYKVQSGKFGLEEDGKCQTSSVHYYIAQNSKDSFKCQAVVMTILYAKQPCGGLQRETYIDTRVIAPCL